MNNKIDALLEKLRKEHGISYISVIVLDSLKKKLDNNEQLEDYDVIYINDLYKRHVEN